MTTTPPTPSDGDGHGPVDPVEGPPAGTALPGAGAGGPRNGKGVAALVCGGLAALFAVVSFVFFPLGVLVFGIAAVVLGIMGIRRAGRGEATNKGQAVAGLLLGVLGLVVFGARTAAFVAQHSEELGRYNQCVQAAASDDERDQCQQRLEEEIRGD
jgi:hypothetical protein